MVKMSPSDNTNTESQEQSAGSEAESRYDQMQRIYRNLFREPEKPDELSTLREALLTFSQQAPCSEERACQLLRKLNDNKEPPFGLDQLAALRCLFVPERTLSPIQRETALGLQARRFWHELVFGSTENLKLLWGALHAYRDPGNPEEARTRVLELLEGMVPGASWTDEQIDDLATFATEEIEFRNLIWWDTFHDVW